MGDKVIRLAIIDDHPIVMDGIRSLVGDDPGISIVITTSSAKDLLEKLEKIQTDILLTDIVMPEMNGNELAKLVLKKF